MTLPESQSPISPAKHPKNTVASMLRDHIQSGEYKPGDWLPTERSLAEDLSVDRRVVRMAIDQLVRDGLVIRRPHCRPIVGPAEDLPAAAPPRKVEMYAPASNLIALLMWHGGHFENGVTSQQRIFWGMSQALANAGYHAVFMDVGEIDVEKENAVREAEQLRSLLKRGFAGAVFYPYAYRSNRELAEEVQRVMPIVTIDRRIEGVETDCVSVNNHQAMYDTIQHLIRQGHRRIAYVTKNEQIRAVQDRIQGYMDAIREAELDEIVLSIPSRDREQVWTSVDMMFHLPKDERPTAASAFNDYAAVDLVKRLKNMGLSVPGDVAVTGFDDIVPILPTGVGLTTMAQPYEEIGRTAVEVLLQRLKSRAAPARSVELPARLMARESSLGPPS
ncbi:GntR family transcriptional regulator [Capsulimonas corticalis]|nr:GntR family transcriptional regulator [Capsulimonas corticalis]